MSFAHSSSAFSLLIGATLTVVDFCLYCHRANSEIGELNNEIAERIRMLEERARHLETSYLFPRVNMEIGELNREIAERIRMLEPERAGYLEMFYLVPLTKPAVCSSIGSLLQNTYRQYSHN